MNLTKICEKKYEYIPAVRHDIKNLLIWLSTLIGRIFTKYISVTNLKITEQIRTKVDNKCGKRILWHGFHSDLMNFHITVTELKITDWTKFLKIHHCDKIKNHFDSNQVPMLILKVKRAKIHKFRVKATPNARKLVISRSASKAAKAVCT